MKPRSGATNDPGGGAIADSALRGPSHVQRHHAPPERAPGDVDRGVSPAHLAVPLVEGEAPARETGHHRTPAVNPDVHLAGAEVLHPESRLGPDVPQLGLAGLETSLERGDEETV